jgi:NADPH:quinone reductase-like Zn-dependent oxidoreductase
MKTMKAMRFNDSTVAPALTAATAPMPQPRPGEMLIHVLAAARLRVLKPADRMVTIAADSEGTQDERTKAAFFIVEPNQQELSEIARLLDRRDLKICVDGVVPLAQASAAYLGTAGRQLGRGKVVISLIEEPSE